ncbi:MAG: hypothetical protein R6V53_05355 [Candidatus Woesearchaeota archaeon]
MSLIQQGVTQILNTYKELLNTIERRDSEKFSDCIIQLDALINQQMQNIDEEMQSSHALRKRTVEFVDQLNKCKNLVAKGSGASFDSNFDNLEEGILEASKTIFLLEYELKQCRPESNLLKD